MPSTAKNSFFLFSAQIGATGLSFLGSILMARLLGTEGMGKWALYNIALSFAVTLLSFSISTTLIYFINSQKYAIEKILGSLFKYTSIVIIGLFLSLLIIKNYWSLDIIFPKSFQGVDYITIFCLMFVNSFISTIFSVIFYALDYFKFQAFILFFSPFLNIIVYSCYFFNFLPITDDPFLIPLYSNFFIGILNLTLILYGYHYFVGLGVDFKGLRNTELKMIINASTFTYIATIFQFLSYRMDYWFINFYINKSQLGIYALGTQVAQLLWILPGTISQVIYSEFAATESEEDTIKNLERTIRLCLFLLIPICFFFILGIYYLLPIIYGKHFEESIWIIAILILGIIPYSIPILMASYFLSKGYFIINTYAGLVGLIISSIMYAILIPIFGIYGAAVGSIVSYLSNCIICIIFIKQKAKIFSIKKALIPNLSDFWFLITIFKSFVKS